MKVKLKINITLYQQNYFCIYMKTHCNNYKLEATNFTSFIHLLCRVKNCIQKIISKTYKLLLFYLIFNTYNRYIHILHVETMV